jgi:hypothetical protein
MRCILKCVYLYIVQIVSFYKFNQFLKTNFGIGLEIGQRLLPSI